MNEEELLNSTPKWVKEDGQFKNTVTGNAVEVFPETDSQDNIVSVVALLYTPNKLQQVAQADDMEELSEELYEFFQDYNTAVGLEE